MPAPSPMQFAQMPGLINAPTVADAMKNMGKNLASANKTLQQQTPAMDPTQAGAAVPGAQGPTAAGGPQGPAPLQGQSALPGSPYSAAAGPPRPMVPNQPQGGAMIGGQPGAPGQTPVGAMAQQPGFLQALIQRIMGGGQGVNPNGVSGMAALNGAGMLAPTMNNPSAYGGA